VAIATNGEAMSFNLRETKIFVALASVFMLCYAALLIKGANRFEAHSATSQSATEVEYARTAAQEGMSEFISIHLSNEPIESGVLIPETQLRHGSSYEVEIQHNEAGNIVVTSRGKYKSSNDIIYEYPIRAVLSPKSD
jgi:hypothetical protein